MKKLVILSAMFFVSLLKSQHTQTFINFTISPSSPTTTDNIRIITDVGFSSDTRTVSMATVQAGNVINLNRCYYMGMLAVYDMLKDTVNVGLLSAGVYTVHYNGVISNSTSICSPSGQTFTSSITFTVVGTPSGIHKNEYEEIQVSAYPNPFKNDLWIDVKNNSESFELKVYDCLGNLVHDEKDYFSNEKIDLSKLIEGVCCIEIISKNLVSKRLRIIKL